MLKKCRARHPECPPGLFRARPRPTWSWWTLPTATPKMSVTTGAIFVGALLIVITTNSIVHFVLTYHLD